MGDISAQTLEKIFAFCANSLDSNVVFSFMKTAIVLYCTLII